MAGKALVIGVLRGIGLAVVKALAGHRDLPQQRTGGRGAVACAGYDAPGRGAAAG